MPQDAFTIKYIAEELKNALTGGKISKITQPARDELTFIIYTAKGNVKLDACLSAQDSRLSLSADEKPVPQNAPNFCMLLRKHLQNAEISDVRQPDFERIIYFDLKCVSDFSASVMRLYFEIMGKYSNAVLCENGVIVGALKTTAIGDNTKRVLFGGVKYQPPEPQDKINPDDVAAMDCVLLTPCPDKAKQISEKIKGICYATALEIVNFYGGNPTGSEIYDYIFNMRREPCVTYLDGNPHDFKVRSSEKDKKIYPDLLQAQSEYYSYVYNKKLFSGKKHRLESALSAAVKKTEKRLAAIRQKLLDCRDAEDIKLKGELLTANLYAVKRGDDRFKAVNYYDANGGTVEIQLDTALTPAQNAQKYYKKYAKLKLTQTSVCLQQDETLQKLDYLNGIASNIRAAENIFDLEETEQELTQLGLLKLPPERKKKPAEIPYRVYFADGFEILAGRNNVQNDRLTRSLAPEDIWLHTQKYHSSHVGIVTGGREVPDNVLLTAAEICAYYSDGREGNKIPVDYTRKKYVKKPPKSNAGFVIYTNYETLLADPDGHGEKAKKNE